MRPAIGATGSFGAWFLRRLFNLAETSPVLDRAFLVVMAVAGAFVVSALVDQNRLVTVGTFFSVVIAAPLYFFTGIVAARRS